MALNFKPPVKKIEFRGGDITVRGLAYPDLTILIDTHRHKAEELFERFTGIREKDAITVNDAGTIAFDLVTTVPAIVAHIISIGADVPDRFEEVSRLPVDVQTSALEEIAKLTFAMEGDLKNFLETVTRIAAGVNRLVDEVKSPQP